MSITRALHLFGILGTLGLVGILGCGDTTEEETSPTPEPSADGIAAQVAGTYIGDAVVEGIPRTDYEVIVEATGTDQVLIVIAEFTYDVQLLDTGSGELTNMPGIDPIVSFLLGDSILLGFTSEDTNIFSGEMQ